MTHASLEQAASQAAEIIQGSSYPIALTGAGISVPSGIPDFRSANTGLWSKNNPMEVASLTAFRHTPERFFNWLRPLAREMWAAQPNPAHFGLARLEQVGKLKAVITQNIDGLHQRAGSQAVIEVHGSMETLSCLNCRQHFPAQAFAETFIQQAQMPRCPNCNALVKPDIVLFEELLPVQAWQQAQAHAEQADLVLVIGSSLEVTPAANLPLYALDHGAQLIINTMSPTYLDRQAAMLIPYDVAEIIPLIAQKILD